MEIIHQPVTFTTLFSKMIDNITSTKAYDKFKSDLVELKTVEEHETTK